MQHDLSFLSIHFVISLYFLTLQFGFLIPLEFLCINISPFFSNNHILVFSSQKEKSQRSNRRWKFKDPNRLGLGASIASFKVLTIYLYLCWHSKDYLRKLQRKYSKPIPNTLLQACRNFTACVFRIHLLPQCPAKPELPMFRWIIAPCQPPQTSCMLRHTQFTLAAWQASQLSWGY